MSSNLIEKCIYEELLYICYESIKVKYHPEFFVTDVKKYNGLHLFSHQVVSDSLRSYGMQHAMLPCPSPSPSLLKRISLKKVSVQKGSMVFRPKF